MSILPTSPSSIQQPPIVSKPKEASKRSTSPMSLISLIKVTLLGTLAVMAKTAGAVTPTAAQCSGYWLTNTNHENGGITNSQIRTISEAHINEEPDLCKWVNKGFDCTAVNSDLAQLTWTDPKFEAYNTTGGRMPELDISHGLDMYCNVTRSSGVVGATEIISVNPKNDAFCYLDRVGDAGTIYAETEYVADGEFSATHGNTYQVRTTDTCSGDSVAIQTLTIDAGTPLTHADLKNAISPVSSVTTKDDSVELKIDNIDALRYEVVDGDAITHTKINIDFDVAGKTHSESYAISGNHIASDGSITIRIEDFRPGSAYDQSIDKIMVADKETSTDSAGSQIITHTKNADDIANVVAVGSLWPELEPIVYDLGDYCDGNCKSVTLTSSTPFSEDKIELEPVSGNKWQIPEDGRTPFLDATYTLRATNEAGDVELDKDVGETNYTNTLVVELFFMFLAVYGVNSKTKESNLLSFSDNLVSAERQDWLAFFKQESRDNVIAEKFLEVFNAITPGAPGSSNTIFSNVSDYKPDLSLEEKVKRILAYINAFETDINNLDLTYEPKHKLLLELSQKKDLFTNGVGFVNNQIEGLLATKTENPGDGVDISALESDIRACKRVFYTAVKSLSLADQYKFLYIVNKILKTIKKQKGKDDTLAWRGIVNGGSLIMSTPGSVIRCCIASYTRMSGTLNSCMTDSRTTVNPPIDRELEAGFSRTSTIAETYNSDNSDENGGVLAASITAVTSINSAQMFQDMARNGETYDNGNNV